MVLGLINSVAASFNALTHASELLINCTNNRRISLWLSPESEEKAIAALEWTGLRRVSHPEET